MKIEGNINTSANGYYSLSVLDKEGNRVEEKCSKTPTQNVVTYEGAFYSLLGGISSNMFDSLYGAVGTGTTEITRSSTGLGAEVSGRTSVSNSLVRNGNEVDNLDGTSTISLTRTMSFSLGEKVGTFSEIGVFTSSTTGGGTFIAGQLIKDELGNPTTITVLSDEQLIITYTLEFIIPNSTNMIGSGVVQDADLNNYNYEVWAQPYFTEYSINSSCENTRYKSPQDGVSFQNAALDPRGNIDTGQDVWATPVHDGSGNVTLATNNYTLSPTSGSFSNMTYFGLGASSAYGTSGFGVTNATTVLDVSYTYAYVPVIIKFLDPVTKTTNDSFSLQVSITITV